MPKSKLLVVNSLSGEAGKVAGSNLVSGQCVCIRYSPCYLWCSRHMETYSLCDSNRFFIIITTFTEHKLFKTRDL